MTEISVSAISTVRAAETSGMLARAPVPVKTETPVTSVSRPVAPTQDKALSQEKTLRPDALSAKLVTPVPDKALKPVETSSAPLVGNASNIALQFRVDDKTKDVTVFVVDRSSKRVLRSIPASELAKLKAGDLLKLTA
jgi:hypothetical protein